MKKISSNMKAMLLTLVALFFVSCATAPITPPESFHTPLEVMYWVHDNIQYVSNPKSVEQAQRPEETLALRTGNCVDQAVLMLYLVENEEHLTGHVVILRSVDEKLSGHPVGAGHLVVSIDGYSGLYDPTEGEQDFSIPAGCIVSTN